ncbi:MAG: hypothetical protein GY720_15280 [bacterium]|nr:hypothetical protein [bacterium]
MRGSWSDVDVATWSPAATGAATAMVILTTLMGARVWAVLNDGPANQARGAYYSALIGKYIPGGVFQAIGQVGYATQTGATVRSAAKTLALSMVTTGAAGLILAGSASLVTAFNPPVRFASAVSAAVGLVLLKRTVLDRLGRGVLTVFRRQPTADWLPPHNKVISSAAWALGGLALLAVSFAVVARQIEPSIPVMATISAFAVAWLVGFIAIPFPAGIGIREAVLVGLLAQSAPAAAVIAMSLAHRLVTIAAEIVVYLVSRHRTLKPI